MAFLGSFGAALKELDPAAERDTFEFFGETFTVIGAPAPILMFQVGAAVNGRVEETEGMAAMWQLWETCLGTEGFQQFYQLALSRRADLESLLRVVLALFETSSGRPTEEPQGSSNGPSTTSRPSNDSSTHPALAHLVPVESLLSG